MTMNRRPTMILTVRLMMRACLMVGSSDITDAEQVVAVTAHGLREHLDLITENDDNHSENYSVSLGH